jgi:hypothetical protein
MTLDEAIIHCNEVAFTCNKIECSNDHKELANWLEELKFFRSWYKKWFIDSEDNINLELLNLRQMLVKEKAALEKLDGGRLWSKLLSSMQDCISILNRLKDINYTVLKGTDWDIDFNILENANQHKARQKYVEAVANKFKNGAIDFGEALEDLKLNE